jgi:hypothetical protein
MRRTVALVLLIVGGAQFTSPRPKATTAGQEVEAVDFCDLFHHPGRYTDNTVKVSATYVLGFHEATLFDNACRESPSGPHLEAKVKFARDSNGSGQAFKTLTDFLKRYKTSQARVTIVAVFRDDYSSGVVHEGSPRYTLEVKQLLAVVKVKPPAESN